MQTSTNRLQTEEQCLKVSELTELIKLSLEPAFTDLTVEGEISNFRPSSTGHCYFTLKDRDSMIQAVMFRNRLGYLTFEPSDGQLVRVHGSLSVYARRGTYQIICEDMEKAGTGDILAMLEERKRRLAAEGLFDSDRKKPLPVLPAKIAVITSPTGAALKDILRVLKRRNSGVDVIILPAPVQGEEAAGIIASRIEYANRHNLGEVLIIGRGGGSLEDLLPFSDEAVVRAIAASAIPIISAVGHEVDTSLSDYAADVRAPTPSAAAEIVSAAQAELSSRVNERRRFLHDVMERRLERSRMLLSQFTQENLERNLRIMLQPLLLRLDDAKDILTTSLSDRLKDCRHKLELRGSALAACSPFEILGRGYAVVTHQESGTVITDQNSVSIGETLNIRLAVGSLEAQVERKHDKREHHE